MLGGAIDTRGAGSRSMCIVDDPCAREREREKMAYRSLTCAFLGEPVIRIKIPRVRSLRARAPRPPRADGTSAVFFFIVDRYGQYGFFAREAKRECNYDSALAVLALGNRHFSN